MTYRHPLAYLMGVEGFALLRAYAGEYDQEFVEARLAEMRVLLDAATLIGDGIDAGEIDTVEGYRAHAAGYDQPGNGLIDIEQPIVREILDCLPVGVALDAACGTGRHAQYLAGLGHRVVGVDSSPDMLAVARTRVPDAEFLDGDLHRLPVPDAAYDVVVCGLALSHVPALRPVIAEFVRVLRPGGHLVISDVHVQRILLGSRMIVSGPDGQLALMPTSHFLASDYLDAALPLGLQVRRYVEPRQPAPVFGPHERPPVRPDPTEPSHSCWDLHEWCPDAVRAAFTGTPVAIIWHFQRAEDR